MTKRCVPRLLNSEFHHLVRWVCNETNLFQSAEHILAFVFDRRKRSCVADMQDRFRRILNSLCRNRDHHKSFCRQCGRFLLPAEAAPRHPDVAEQPNPRTRCFKVACEFPVNFAGSPVELLPGSECAIKLIAVLKAYGLIGAVAPCVDHDASFFVELEPMMTGHMP